MTPLSLKTLDLRLQALESGDTSALVERIKMLEACLSKTATLSGNGNHLKEFGLARWNPNAQDMRKKIA